MRVFAEAAEARVFHFRTKGGEREADFIVERDDHCFVALEVKLSATVEDNDVAHLVWLRDQMPGKFIEGIVLTTGRHAYRRKKWKMNVLADGRAWVVRKTHLRFDENVHSMDDYAWTARNLAEFGVVVINNWVLPDCRRYTAGGYGSKEQRMTQKITEARYLVETYPDYVAYKAKAGWPEGSHVTIRQRHKRRTTAD